MYKGIQETGAAVMDMDRPPLLFNSRYDMTKSNAVC
jgi:hypothetical protein